MFICRKNFPVIIQRPRNLKVAVQLIRMILFDTVFLLLLLYHGSPNLGQFNVKWNANVLITTAKSAVCTCQVLLLLSRKSHTTTDVCTSNIYSPCSNYKLHVVVVVFTVQL